MLTIIDVEALLVDDITAYSAWWRVANSAIFKSLVPDLEAIMVTKKFLSAASIVFALALLTSTTNADNSWGNYHWARTTPSFDLTVVNSTTSEWVSHVGVAISDWSMSTKLNMVEDPNGSTSKKDRRQCKGPSGQIRICNLAYGQTGWLGIAGISIDANNHITKGYTKLNDTYFSMTFYKDPSKEWKQSVTCQELGHNVGLHHQDVDFNNDSLYSCMDYQDPPHPSPNDHDYAQLDEIYGHDDDWYNSYDDGGSTGGDGGGGGGGCNAPKGKGCNKSGIGDNNGDIGWGMSLGRRGQLETFIRIDRDGTRHMTHVIWAIGY